MATIQTPQINRIIRLTEYDMLNTGIKQYNMYLCTDSGNLYYDVDPSRRVLYNYTPVKTLNDLYNNVIPSVGVTYYCWETNSLWLWMNRWISIYTDSSYPSAYDYNGDNQLYEIYKYGDASLPADDNGLLKDGSVVIRDRNRIIKGKIYIGDNNDNFIISSFLGGGLILLPNGKLTSAGQLYLTDFDAHKDNQDTTKQKYSSLTAEFHIMDNELYVNYSNSPELDDNPYPNDTHLYKVYYEGNLKLSGATSTRSIDNSQTSNLSAYSVTTSISSSKPLTITHNLNTSNIVLSVKNNSTNELYNNANIKILDNNSVQITIPSQTGTQQFTINIIGINI